MGRVVRKPSGTNCETVKPEPPAGMWRKLHAELIAENAAPRISRPENSFTMREFQAEFAISRSIAKDRLNKLRAAGKLRMEGSGSQQYYVLV